MSLAGTVVGVLAEDDDLNLVNRNRVESIENKFGRRKDGAVFVFLFDKFGQFLKIRLLKFVFKQFLPGSFETDFHKVYFNYVEYIRKRGKNCKKD